MIRRPRIQHPARTTRRRGMISMELVFVLPMLMVLLTGIFEITLLLAARSDVVQASRAGARLAVLHGIEPADVEQAVRNSLTGKFRSTCQVRTQLGEYPGDDVWVAVRVPMSAAAPNLLWIIGFDLQGRYLVNETRMLKE